MNNSHNKNNPTHNKTNLNSNKPNKPKISPNSLKTKSPKRKDDPSSNLCQMYISTFIFLSFLFYPLFNRLLINYFKLKITFIQIKTFHIYLQSFSDTKIASGMLEYSTKL